MGPRTTEKTNVQKSSLNGAIYLIITIISIVAFCSITFSIFYLCITRKPKRKYQSNGTLDSWQSDRKPSFLDFRPNEKVFDYISAYGDVDYTKSLDRLPSQKEITYMNDSISDFRSVSELADNVEISTIDRKSPNYTFISGKKVRKFDSTGRVKNTKFST